MHSKPIATTIVLATIAYTTILTPHSVLAETMESDSYKIRFGNFNITSGTKTSTSYTLTDTVGQTAAGEFNSTGYTVKAGFQYMYTLFPFSFSISSLTIDFGTLTPNSPSTATNTITISSPSASGYTVTVFEDHPLQSINGDQISDTTCDDGSCSETSASAWTLSTIHGFGFNISGNDTPSDFIDSTYFRQFADASSNESPQVIMSSSQSVKNHTATITYKLNISGSQAAGTYANNLTFIATPSY